mgnify:CR=1 FL=1
MNERVAVSERLAGSGEGRGEETEAEHRKNGAKSSF